MSQPSRSRRPEDSAILVNKLTVGDARDLLRSEGGPISVGRIAWRFITIVAVAAFTARAIVLGKATAWHLFLPMVGEYLVLAISLPVINLFIHDETLRQDVRRSRYWLIALLIGLVVWISIDSWRHGHPWGSQIPEQWGRLSHWVVSHQMHWPILGASVGMSMSLPGRVQTFLEHGPPFVPIGIGCAMRVVVVLFGCFLIPAIIGNSARIVWSIWAVLVLSELGALWMHWDVQTRLRKKGIAL